MTINVQYDEGESFFYFVLGLLVLALILLSYFFWPWIEGNDLVKNGSQCACDNCERKRTEIREAHLSKEFKRKIVLIAAWTVFALLAYKIAAVQKDTLGLEPEENPDEPGIMEPSITLPDWLIVGLYGMLITIIIPTVTAVWWFRSGRKTSNTVKVDTIELFKHHLRCSSTLDLKRILLILSGACEFDSAQNPEIIPRPDDSIYIQRLQQSLGIVQENITKRQSEAPYSVKARALLLSHLDRTELPVQYLREDLNYILKKCPMLISEMISETIRMEWSYLNSMVMFPKTKTIENIMKMSQMLVQGLNEHSSALLQIPNIDAEILRNFSVEKSNIKPIEQLLRFPDNKRRELFRNLTKKQYDDTMSVGYNMPHIGVQVELRVWDDEDVMVGAINTVVVRLTRHNLGDWVKSGATNENTNKKTVSVTQETNKAQRTKNKDVDRFTLLGAQSKYSHSVHCPYFPEDKQEWWWVYLADNNRNIISPPFLVTNLVAEATFELKVTCAAPGICSFTVVVESDSYLDVSTISDFEVEVYEPKETNMSDMKKDNEDGVGAGVSGEVGNGNND